MVAAVAVDGGMKFLSHLVVGSLVLVAFVVIAGVKDTAVLAGTAVALLIGAIIPDIDHPFSHIRKLFRVVSFIVLSVITFLFLTTAEPSRIVQDACLSYGCSDFILPVKAVLALVVSFIAVMIVDFLIPFHRGPLHGIAAAAAYAIICGLVAEKYFSGYPVIALAGFVGYLSHIIPDMLFKE